MASVDCAEAWQLVVDAAEASSESLAIVDADGLCTYTNPAARQLLADRMISEVSQVVGDEALQVVRWPFVSDGRSLTAFSFHEAERTGNQMQRVAAFARTAARIACRGPLQEVLDRVALEARNATRATSCSIILLESGTFDVRLVGTAGHEEDYLERLMESVRLGAPLASLEAFRTGRPARRSRIRDMIAEDARYAPLAEPTRKSMWEHVVAVPAVLQDRCVGVLTSFYGPEARPSEEDVVFLLALADQTAVAVDNANLFDQLQTAAAAAERHELAIDLHDTVSQALFSVIMQSRALGMRARAVESPQGADLVHAIERLESTAEAMQREIRGLIRQMNPEERIPALAEDLTVLRSQLAGAAGADGPRIELDIPEEPLPSVDGTIRRELLLVLREAITNAVRHARAQVVTVRLRTNSGSMVATVSDDGTGFDQGASSPGRLGLRSMARRTHRLGGSLEIDPDTAGTTVTVVVPLVHTDANGIR